MGQGSLSYHGFLEKVFKNNLRERGASELFTGLDEQFKGRALIKLSEKVISGAWPVPNDLQTRFPELYEPHLPELYGHSAPKDGG
jgi:hypothetical protein